MPLTATPLPLLESVVNKIERVATLAQVALTILRVANDPNAGVADMKSAIESDPALCTSVLRCANSSAYALKFRITNIQQAIAYLGVRQIRNLAMAPSISKLFQNNRVIGSYSRPGLWRHMVSVGICARLLGMRLNYHNCEDLFLAGLLHDIGIVLEDQEVHDQFCQVMQTLDPRKTLIENERQHLTFDHCQLGELVAEKWALPQAVKAAIAYHHNPAEVPSGKFDVVQYIEVANVICTFKDISSIGVNLVQACPASIEALTLTKKEIIAVSDQLDQELSESAAMFGISKPAA